MAYTFGTEEWEKAYCERVKERLETEPKPFMIATPEWLEVYEKNLQTDSVFQKAGKGWEGSVVIKILAEPEIGLDDDLFLFLDLWNGECRSIRIVPADVGENATFVLTGAYDKWKSVILKETDPVKGLMQGKLKLKGDIKTLIGYVKAAVRIVELAPECRYPDVLTASEIEDFRAWMSGLRAEFNV
jgi:putative sterol carrier protein